MDVLVLLAGVEVQTGSTGLFLLVRRGASGGVNLLSALECEFCLRLFRIVDLVAARERR